MKDLNSSNRFAFALHLWRSAGQWRISLKSLETGKRLGFACLEQFFAYIMDLVEGNFNKQPDTEIKKMDEPRKRN